MQHKIAEPGQPGSKEFYDQFADTYDQGVRQYWNIEPYVTHELPNWPSIRAALVIGVGTGQELKPILESGVLAIEAIDMSPNMLTIAKSKYPTVSFHLGDFMGHSEFRHNVYDLITACGVFELFPDADLFLKRAADLLSSDGVMFLTFTPILRSHPTQRAPISVHPDYPGHAERRYSFEQFYEYVQDAGLMLVSAFTFDCYISGYNSVQDLCFFCVLKKSSVTKGE